MTTCTVPGCDRKHKAHGLCDRHYSRWWVHNEIADKRDDRAIAYYTGSADARNRRPRRVDIADTSFTGRAYTRGYNSLIDPASDRARWRPYTASQT